MAASPEAASPSPAGECEGWCQAEWCEYSMCAGCAFCGSAPVPDASPPAASPPEAASPSDGGGGGGGGTFELRTINSGQTCPSGWRQATQAECSAIASQGGAGFQTHDAGTLAESGCMRWGGVTGSTLEYMQNSNVYPCAADICYCTR